MHTSHTIIHEVSTNLSQQHMRFEPHLVVTCDVCSLKISGNWSLCALLSSCNLVCGASPLVYGAFSFSATFEVQCSVA